MKHLRIISITDIQTLMATLHIIFITLLAIANGTLLTRLVINRMSLPARLCAGSVIGLAMLSWIGFLSSLIVGLNVASISTTVAILLSGLFALFRLGRTAGLPLEIKKIRLSKSGLVYYAAWTGLLAWLFSRVVMFTPDGLHTAPANNYGDLPFHFSVITSFAYGENLPPHNPIFAGMKFTYPFLIDFLTAFFIRCGADWRAAFFVENIILSLSLVGLIELLTKKLFGSTLAARIAPLIFLFNGGFGFINFFSHLRQFFEDPNQAKQGLVTLLVHLPNTYTMNANLLLSTVNVPLTWGNVFTTLLIPQRSMLFGLPFVAIIIILWWMAVNEGGRAGERESGSLDSISPLRTPSPTPPLPHSSTPPLSPARRYLLAAGILTGLLPMLHGHGFFAVMIASVLMVVLFLSWDWIAFYIPVAVLGAPQALWLSDTPVRNNLFKKELWWVAGESNPLIFWAVNAGVLILLLLVALLSKKITTPRLRIFYLPFALWFIVPNLVLLAPWPWDNIKVLVYWSLVSSPFVAAVLAYLFTQRIVVLRILAVALLIALTFSGALDVLRALSPAENVPLFGKPELEVAALLREKTPPGAVILHAPIHNSVVALSGRQSVMGYPGHLWTHGINYSQRESEVAAIYRGGVESVDLLSSLNVDYLIISPVEQSRWNIDESYFENRYRRVIDYAGYRVYQTK